MTLAAQWGNATMTCTRLLRSKNIGQVEGACPLNSESLSHLFLMSAIDGKPSTQFDEVLRRCDQWTAEAMEKGLRPFIR